MVGVNNQTFTTIPTLDLSLADSPRSKRLLLSELRNALVVVGFFYLTSTERWIKPETKSRFVEKSIEVCNMPMEKKLEIDMINSKHFLGYSRMGCERTARKIDHREMFDFLSPLPAPGPDDPVYLNVQGPNQWPDSQTVPGFREALETYLAEVGELGHFMRDLVAEALELDPGNLASFFNDPPRNKVSLLKYPEPDPTTECQGVGSHKDGGFLTYLLQATPHAGLEAQNKKGEWIAVPPRPDALVVNVGRSLEAITHGVCTATTHRVNLHPSHFEDPTATARSLGPRYSFPVFQTLKLDLSTEKLLSLRLPAHVARLVADEHVKSDAEAYFATYHRQNPGIGIFTARLTSHPDVGRRWYPEIAAQVLKGQAAFGGV
ncbi:2og-fe oxygenase [Diplodia corticola]|uniref:2og-fe oxygenase n=1 Tax=Diplodia corticola TaxID=236234 RepID=A0A1J9R0A5_9PEZI|nr:2og-fe oxygenase [Diplodia corticola]OJD33682.1 2og-fe oxygenase [Diplodia corticola]